MASGGPMHEVRISGTLRKSLNTLWGSQVLCEGFHGIRHHWGFPLGMLVSQVPDGGPIAP